MTSRNSTNFVCVDNQDHGNSTKSENSVKQELHDCLHTISRIRGKPIINGKLGFRLPLCVG